MLLIALSIFSSLGNLTLTGNVIGSNYSSYLSWLSIISFVVGVVIMMMVYRIDISTLERKLKEIENVKIRRELLSDAHRAFKFAKRGLDVNGLWDYTKSYEENKRNFFNHFYDDVDEEIRVDFLKQKGLLPNGLAKPDFQKVMDDFKAIYSKTEEYKDFREKALKAVILWNEKVLSGEFTPLYILESDQEPRDFPGKKMRMVFYGTKEFKGREEKFYKDKGRETGEIVAAHEIINPEAENEPSKLKETPHIHWELTDLMKKKNIYSNL